jgi:putative endonuclease
MADKDERGRAGEQRAVDYLTERGYRIVDRNWRCRSGEIDVVASRARRLVVVEVKCRRTDWFGHPLEAVDARKQNRLWRLACAWIAAHPDEVQGQRLQLDVIAITGDDPATAVLEHLEDLR